MSVILGLRSKHDASAALIVDGKLVAAAQEERFTRKKHYFGFPQNAIAYVLSEAGVRPEEVDIIARDGLPWKKTFQRLFRQLRTAWAPRLYTDLLQKAWNRYFIKTQDVKLSEDSQLIQMGFQPNWYYVEHHLGHAAYAYYASGVEDATVIVMDGRGHYLGGAIYTGNGNHLNVISEILAEGGSLGLFYSAITDALGFHIGDGEGKTMGLSCYGDPKIALDDLMPFAPQVDGLFVRKSKEWDLETDIADNRLYGHYKESAKLRLLIDKFGKENIAAAAQFILEEKLEELVVNAVAATGNRNLVTGGGLFLNIKASKNLLDKGVVDTIYVPPGPGDDGLAAGYVLAAYAATSGQRPSAVKSAYLGPSFSNDEILDELRKTKNIVYEHLEDIAESTARLVADGYVVGWFQGRMEWGPRALGNRSVLADPRDPNMRDRINHLLKKRDWFMPFAPSVLQEYCHECFVNYHASPYMNLAFDVHPPYDTSLPAIMHVDKTARPQAVDRDTNPLYHETIDAFRQLTGIPMVLNTSFNRHGLPIVCYPKDAIEHLLMNSVDVLVIGPYLVRRAD